MQRTLLKGDSCRDAERLHVDKTRLAKELSPKVAGTNIYNKLPAAIKSLSQRQFKLKLKEWLLDVAPYSVKEFIDCIYK